MRTTVREGAAVVLLAALAAANAPAAVQIETCDALRWTGAPPPRLDRYAPPLAPPAAALVFETAKGAAREWSRPVKVDLSASDSLAVRLGSTRAITLVLRLQSGPGRYARAFDVTSGEQTVIIPLGAFARDDRAGDLDKVESMALTSGAENETGTFHLMGIAALGKGEMPATDGVCLYRPVSRVSPVGALWPIRAIVHSIDYPARGERAPDALQRRLMAISGVQLPVNPKGVAVSPGTTNVVLLGAEAATQAHALTREEIARQGWQGFVVRADAGRIVIAGETRHGTAYGVYRFLERQGCRFYAPACEELPAKTAVLRVCDFAEKPFFDAKRISGGYSILAQPSDVLGDPRQAEDPEMWKNSTLWIDHTAPYLVPIRKYYDEHPDYFALRADGRRLPKDTTDVRVMVCTTHPDVLRISAERALRWIEIQKDRSIFCVTQGDDHEWCACERCRAMVYEPGNYSDAMLGWVNHVAREVAKRYPDKILLCFAYGPTQPPPVKLRPERNVVVLYAAWPNATSAPCGVRDFDAPENIVAYTEITGWLKVAPDNVGLYDYNSGGAYTLNGMAWKVKWSARHGLRGFWYCGTNLSFQPLFTYVHAQLNWDPFQDIEPLKRRFVNAYYGPAAPVMGRVIDAIYDRIEYGHYDARMHSVPPADYFTKPFVEATLRDFDQAVELLAQVKSPVAQEVMNDRRVFVENCLRMTAPGGRDVDDEHLQVFGIAFKRYLDQWQSDREKALARGKAGKPPTFDALADTLWVWTRVRLGKEGPDGKAPELLATLRDDPVGTIRRLRVTELTERTADGWRIPGEAFSGGKFFRAYNWKCEARDAVTVYGTMSEFSVARAVLNLKDAPPDREGVLEMLGQDSDKVWCAPVPIQVIVNGRKLLTGPNPFPKCGWSRVQDPLPKGLLRPGENVIEVRNLVNSDSLVSHWVMISEVVARFPAPK